MKSMRTITSLLTVLFLVSTLNLTTGDAQNSPQLIHTLVGHTHYVGSVAYSPDGRTIVSAGLFPDKTIHLWNAATGALRNTLVHERVTSVVYSPDGGTLVSGSYDGKVHLWSPESGTLLNTLTPESYTYIKSVAISSDGKMIASGSDTGVCVWNRHTGDLINEGYDRGDVVAFSPNGNTLATASYGGVYFWNPDTREPLGKLEHFSQVRSFAYSPDGGTVASSDGTEVFVWNVHTKTRRDTYTILAWVNAIAFSPDNRTIACNSGNREVELWDTRTGTLLHTLTGHKAGARSFAFSPDGSILVVGTNDKEVLVWRISPSISGEAPEFTEGDTATRTIAEDAAVGVDIGTPVTATDADSETLTYTLSGPGAGAFGIDSDTGQLRTNAPLDYGTQPTYTVTITVSDGALSDTISVTINVTQVETHPNEDVNNDGVVNIQDLVLTATNFGATGENAADVNNDGVVNIMDLVLVAGAF